MTTRRRTTTTRRRTGTYYRRRRPTVAASVGSAIGLLIFGTLAKLSWPAKIGLVVVALVLGLAYLVWHNRSAIAAEAAATSEPASPDGATPPPAQPGAPSA